MHTKSTSLQRTVIISLCCLSAPTAAHADGILPIGWIFWPIVSSIALILVILIEAWIARRILGLKRRTALLRSGLANVTSAIVGIPFSWGLFLVLERTTAELGRLPYGDAFNWVVPSAGIVLLIPFFYISVFVERWAFDIKRTTGQVTGEIVELESRPRYLRDNTISNGLHPDFWDCGNMYGSRPTSIIGEIYKIRYRCYWCVA